MAQTQSYPLKGKGPEKEERSFKVMALDCETDGLGGDILYASLYHEDWSEPLGFKDMTSALDFIFAMPPALLKRTIIYSHNANYDWNYFIDSFPSFADRFYVMPRERAAGRYYEMKVYERGSDAKLVTTFRDSFALFSQKLETFSKYYAPKFAKQPIDFEKVKFSPKNKDHVAYALNDARCLVECLINFDALIYRNFQVHIKGTAASTAYAAWRVAYEGDAVWRQAPGAEAFIRKCYFGGLVQINDAAEGGGHTVRTFDRNSSYPAAMREGVPVGKATRTFHYHDDKPGFYHVVATVPDDAVLPIVPHRGERGDMSWPTGTFKTYLTSKEIDYCRTLGCTFKILTGFYFERLGHPFNGFVDKCEKLRNDFKRSKDKGSEEVVKIMQNSLYGRFGMKPEGREYRIDYEGVPDGFLPMIDPDSGVPQNHVYVRKCERSSEYMLPHWAAWITASARIALDKDTEAYGRHKVNYRDTDSITGDPEHNPEFDARLDQFKYGAMKDEGEKLDFVVTAPKVYSYRTLDTDGSTTWVAKCKGIPKRQLTPEVIQELNARRVVEAKFLSVNSPQTYLRSGQKAVMRKRRSTDTAMVYGHRVVNGWFRPRHIVEVLSDGRGEA